MIAPAMDGCVPNLVRKLGAVFKKPFQIQKGEYSLKTVLALLGICGLCTRLLPRGVIVNFSVCAFFPALLKSNGFCATIILQHKQINRFGSMRFASGKHARYFTAPPPRPAGNENLLWLAII